ncbi:SDR family oxidoreductase [Bacillus sp. 2205SS5-2]|uniref:SDR family oxidoreductase n=1 Tax=Bacillus sp. 2205SS5-2 TaxID=3109031 RepID=UPI0030058B48
MSQKVILITGSAKGLGKKVAEHFAALGHTIIINYRHSKDAAMSFVEYLQQTYCIEAKAIQCDVSDPESCERMVHAILNDFQRIDILIHNAGPYIKERKALVEYSQDEWQYILNGNVSSAFYLSKLIIPVMRKWKWGRIITFGYDRVETAPGWIYRSAFAASKAALASLTRTISIEEAPNGITANMVCPGDILEDWKESDIATSRGVEDSEVPIGRPGTGEDIARTVGFLCEEKADFITGSILPVTGGKDVLRKIYHEKG